MSKFTDNYVVELVIDGQERKLGKSIREQNIEMYKYQDYINSLSTGQEIADDSLYEKAEDKLQEIYHEIMEG